MSGVAEFFNRIRKNARHFGKWARRRRIECYRVYDRDIPEFAYALDIYGRRAHLQEYEWNPRARTDAEADEHLRQGVAEALSLPVPDVIFKRRTRRLGGEQHEKLATPGHDFEVHEAGRRFIVNLEAHLDTGLFLDHRITRSLVAQDAAGRRLLNLFCYTGSFTVYAATAGAASSLSIDLSNIYLEWARRNFLLNGIDVQHHQLLRADVTRWLAEAVNTPQRYDIIVLDPPSVSRSKAMATSFDVQRDHAKLIAMCAQLLAPEGVLYFSTNLQRFRLEPHAFTLLDVEEISQRTVPEDFRNRRIHRCWRAKREE